MPSHFTGKATPLGDPTLIDLDETGAHFSDGTSAIFPAHCKFVGEQLHDGAGAVIGEAVRVIIEEGKNHFLIPKGATKNSVLNGIRKCHAEKP